MYFIIIPFNCSHRAERSNVLKSGLIIYYHFKVVMVWLLFQVDAVVNDALKLVNADDGKIVDEAEFKKTLTEILGSLMLQLEGNPISVSSNSVVHGPLESSSTLFPPSTLSSSQNPGE